MRLLDLLGYGVHPKPSNLSSAVSTGVVVTPFRLLAYQKIFNDFYRLPLYQPVDVYSFNIDDCISNSTGDVDLGSVPFDDGSGTTTGKFNRLKPMYTLRYRLWKRDYFTNNRPTFAGAQFMSLDPSPVQLPIAGPNNGFASVNSHQSVVNTDTYSGFTISNLRSAFALDKLLDLTTRAKDGSYAAQVAAHFGFNVQTDSSKCLVS